MPQHRDKYYLKNKASIIKNLLIYIFVFAQFYFNQITYQISRKIKNFNRTTRKTNLFPKKSVEIHKSSFIR